MRDPKEKGSSETKTRRVKRPNRDGGRRRWGCRSSRNKNTASERPKTETEAGGAGAAAPLSNAWRGTSTSPLSEKKKSGPWFKEPRHGSRFQRELTEKQQRNPRWPPRQARAQKTSVAHAKKAKQKTARRRSGLRGGRKPLAREKPSLTTPCGGSLGSCVDEERS